jgi:hypothetical protein
VCIICRVNVFTKLWLATIRGIHIQTHGLMGGGGERFMKYAVEMVSGAMIYMRMRIRVGGLCSLVVVHREGLHV